MKKVLSLMLVLILMIVMTTTVNASTGSISLSTSSNTATSGDIITLTLTGSSDTNITAFQGTLSYDTTKLQLQSKATGTGFSDLSSGDTEIAILATGASDFKSGTLYTLTFKVLDNVTEGTANVSITSPTLAVVNGEQENLSVSNVSVDLTIKKDNTTVDGGEQTNNVAENNTTSEENKVTVNNTKNTSSSNKSNNTTTDNNKKTLPQTGLGFGTIISIIVVIIIGIVSYRKYKNV